MQRNMIAFVSIRQGILHVDKVFNIDQILNLKRTTMIS